MVVYVANVAQWCQQSTNDCRLLITLNINLCVQCNEKFVCESE